MRVEYNEDGTVAGLVVSRRNLITMLAKLNGAPDGSACQILAPIQYGTFYLKAEEDGEHYYHAEREAHGEAGEMHPDTERALLNPLSVEDKLALDAELASMLRRTED